MRDVLKAIIGAAVLIPALLWMASCAHDLDARDCAQLGVELEARTKFVRGKCHVLPVREL